MVLTPTICCGLCGVPCHLELRPEDDSSANFAAFNVHQFVQPKIDERYWPDAVKVITSQYLFLILLGSQANGNPVDQTSAVSGPPRCGARRRVRGRRRQRVDTIQFHILMLANVDAILGHSSPVLATCTASIVGRLSRRLIPRNR